MRVENWAAILADHIQSSVGKPFIWGERDCCLWVADIVNDMTGVDYAAEFRGKYHSKSEAIKLLSSKYGSLQEYLDVLFDEVRLTYAKRGDVVVSKFDGMHALGIVVDSRAAFTAATGLAYIPVLDCIRAWSID